MIFCAIILVTLGFQTVLGQTYVLRCPNVQAVQNFNGSAYMGKWYEQEKHPVISESGGKCITVDYTADGDDKATFRTKIIVDEETKIIDGSAKLNSESGEGKLEATFNLPIPITTSTWVLGTDYSKYAVVWACKTVWGFSTGTAWILTRERNPSEDLIKTAYDIFKKNNVDTDLLIKTDQKNCS